MGSGALRGLRVLDFGQYLPGPMLAMLLADNGADVIHVDPPGGPRWQSPANAALYRNKRPVELDLKSAAGLAAARALAMTADVVIENFRPGVMTRLGLDPRELRAAAPRLVWCSLPGFPRDDPRAGVPGWEGVVASATGLYARAHGEVDGEPCFSALPVTANFAAFMAAHRIAGALLTRARTGAGELIEVSLYEAAFQAVGSYAEVPVSRKTDSPVYARLHKLLRTARAADGTHVYFDTPLRGLQTFLDRFLPGYRLLDLDDAAMSRMVERIVELIATKPGAEWERICQEEIEGAFGLCQSTAAWLADDHALASETVLRVDDAELGRTAQPGYGVLLSRSRPRVRWGRRRHDRAGTAIGWEAEGFSLPAPGAGTLPLAGIRVLDCATLLAGPTTTRVLAQYGAEVIKVDKAGLATGDIEPLSDDPSAFHGHRTVSAGKRMVFLDLKHELGRAVLAELLSTVDVVHHNFTTGAARRLGVATEQVRERNPAAICSRMSLHSAFGRRAEYRGHEPLAQMATGMGVRAGGSGEPRMLGVVVNDHAAGHLNAFGVMLALLERCRTGEGQEVNASLSRTATLHQLPFTVGFDGRDWDEPSGPDALGWHALDRLYRAADGWFYVAPGRTRAESAPADPAMRRALAAIPGLDGVESVDDAGLAAWLAERFRGWPAEKAVDALLGAGFGAHRYVPVADLAGEPSVVSRGLLTVMDHPGLGKGLGIGHPVFGAEPASLAARRPGMDTLDVLAEHGFAGRIEELLRARAVALGENPVVNTSTLPGYWTSGRIVSYTSGERLARTADMIMAAHPRPAYAPPPTQPRRHRA
ncbi:CoA transferase [Phytohabitans sp. ZYX-F-186]|uniref:CoA transferase n=1 Tax=Phytohabitans maris TaxID=3071409 RepID=A0ABU0ZTR2_9ACTN|nr:CoA transferase [Phytohabitans sp. ZYX-F-186]MDQ7909337.1 CoA transferase [Phytohabitans sp. ZYX-F-186]